MGDAGSTNGAASTGLGLMNSISPECTPLKHRYDSCFNLWFKEYLDATSPAVQPAESSSRGFFAAPRQEVPQNAAALRDQYESKCGPLFKEYQACVLVRVALHGRTDLSAPSTTKGSTNRSRKRVRTIHSLASMTDNANSICTHSHIVAPQHRPAVHSYSSTKKKSSSGRDLNSRPTDTCRVAICRYYP